MPRYIPGPRGIGTPRRTPTRVREGRTDVPCQAWRMSLLTSRDESGEETPDLYGAFPRLSNEQIATLRDSGTVRRTHRDEVLFRAGERNCDFFVVLSGTVAVIDGFGTPDEYTVALHGPGRFLGEIDLVIGRASLVTAVVRHP